MNTPRCFGKMKHRAKNARCYTAIMFVIETSNRQAGMVQLRAAAALLGRFASSPDVKGATRRVAGPFHPISLLLPKETGWSPKGKALWC